MLLSKLSVTQARHTSSLKMGYTMSFTNMALKPYSFLQILRFSSVVDLSFEDQNDRSEIDVWFSLHHFYCLFKLFNQRQAECWHVEIPMPPNPESKCNWIHSVWLQFQFQCVAGIHFRSRTILPPSSWETYTEDP